MMFSKPLLIAEPLRVITTLDITSGPAALIFLMLLRLLKIFSDFKTKELQVGAETP